LVKNGGRLFITGKISFDTSTVEEFCGPSKGNLFFSAQLEIQTYADHFFRTQQSTVGHQGAPLFIKFEKRVELPSSTADRLKVNSPDSVEFNFKSLFLVPVTKFAKSSPS
jgi:hypothetical protein